MPDLLLRPQTPDADGLVHRVTPESAGWSYVGFELYRLKTGQTLSQDRATKDGKTRVCPGVCHATRTPLAVRAPAGHAWPHGRRPEDGPLRESKLPHSRF